MPAVKSFAVACVLVSSAWAVSMTEQTKTFEFASSSATNGELAKLQYEAMPQGRGKDHTLWDWGSLVTTQEGEVDQAGKDATTADEDVEAAKKALADARAGHPTADNDPAQRFLKCEMIHNEEINLFYQCMQDGANNYALDHFGGEKRSFPRWRDEAQGCHDSIAALAACVPVPDLDRSKACELFQGKRVWVSDSTASWADGAAYCKSYNADLAMPQSKEQQEEIVSLLNGAYAWGGGSDRESEGTWLWNNGARMDSGYQNWYPGEPNNQNGAEHCLQLNLSQMWNDDWCEKKHSFVCESPYWPEEC